MLEVAFGALTTLLGVALGCTVLELAMRALRHSFRAHNYEETLESAGSPASLVAWDGEQISAAPIHSFASRTGAGAQLSPVMRSTNRI